MADIKTIRVTLEAELDRSDVIPASKRTSDFSTVRNSLDVIDEYREKGHSLAQIHQVLVRNNHVSCTINTFKLYYYKARASAAKATQPSFGKENVLPIIEVQENQSRTPAMVSGFSSQSQSEKVVAVTDIGEPAAETVINAQRSGVSEEAKSLPVAQPRKKITYDAEMQEQFALAQKMFADRRAEMRQGLKGVHHESTVP